MMSDDAVILAETGAQKLLGYVIDVGQEDKRARCGLQVDERHLNRHGVLHGGMISCLLDSASGATASLRVDDTGRTPFLSVSLTVNYVAPAYPGWVEAIGEITGGGRNILHINAQLRDDAGRLIATSSGIFKRVPQSRL